MLFSFRRNVIFGMLALVVFGVVWLWFSSLNAQATDTTNLDVNPTRFLNKRVSVEGVATLQDREFRSIDCTVGSTTSSVEAETASYSLKNAPATILVKEFRLDCRSLKSPAKMQTGTLIRVTGVWLKSETGKGYYMKVQEVEVLKP